MKMSTTLNINIMIANGEGNGLAQLVDYKKHHIYHFNHSTVT